MCQFHFIYSKKKILKKKLGEQNLNELTLYHVADAAMVDGICAQNFDWRLLETNLDTYGRGNYFYNDPTKCLANSQTDSRRIRFIFAAKVLAGKYTTVQIIEFSSIFISFKSLFVIILFFFRISFFNPILHRLFFIDVGLN